MLKKISATFGLFLAILFCSVSVFSQPLILDAPDTVSPGEPIVITGTSFGTKLTASPIRFDDFEDYSGAVGSDIDDATGWWNVVDRSTSAVPNAQISSQNQRSSSTFNVIAAVKDRTKNPVFYKNDVGFSITGKIFVSLWMYYDNGTVVPDSSAYQIKAWRLATVISSNGAETYPDIANFNWFYKANTSDEYNNYTQVNHYLGGGSSTHYLPKNTLQKKQWQNFIIEVDQGTPGNADGKVTVYGSVADQSSPYLTSSSAGQVLDSTGNYIDAIKFDSFLDDGTGTFTLYFDDIYIDNSWARVEIGDSSIYENCSHREIQIPTSWSVESVSVNINTGSFSSGDTVYLFVVDSNGIPSAGYPISVLSSSTLNKTVQGESDPDADLIAPTLRIE